MSTLRTNAVESITGTATDFPNSLSIQGKAIGTIATEPTSRFPYVVGSVAELASVPEGLLVDGARFALTEYHEGSGAGGGELYWDAFSTETADGGLIFEKEGTATGRFKRIVTGNITLPMFGATGTGTETSIVQAAIDSGIEIRGSGTYIVNEIIPPANCSIVGDYTAPITFKLASTGKLCTLNNPDIHLENVVFDCDNITLSEPFPVEILAGTKRPTIRNVEFKNYRGGDVGSEIQNCYGLLCELDGVQGFKFQNLKFTNISNQGDGIAMFNGFTGGVFFYNKTFVTIPEDRVSFGVVDGVELDTIFTRYPDGISPADKQADNDADGIRFFSSPGNLNTDIKITNVRGKSVGKRIIKISGTGGLLIDNVYCDGSQPVDTDVSMDSIIKISGPENVVNNVKGYFGSYYGMDAIQTAGADGSIITNILIDDCLNIVGTAGSSANLTIDNISATIHGGLRLENDSPVNGTLVDNCHLIYDRTGRSSANTNRRGASFINITGLKIGKIYLKNGQVLISSCPDSSYDSIDVEWTDTTDPSTTGMGTSPIVTVEGDRLRGGRLSLVTADLLPLYIPSTEGIVRTGNGDQQILGDFQITSKNNNPLWFRSSSNSTLRKLIMDSDKNIVIGGGSINGITVDFIHILSTTTRIRMRDTLTDLFFTKVVKQDSDGTDLTAFTNPTISNIFFERVFWRPGGGVVSPASAITVIDERILS